jgi:phosphoglycerol transferase
LPVLLGIFLLCFSYWIHRSFGQPELNQILYHMNFGVELMDTVDPAVTWRFVRWCVMAPLVLLALVFYVEAKVRAAIARAPQCCHVLCYRLIAGSRNCWCLAPPRSGCVMYRPLSM